MFHFYFQIKCFKKCNKYETIFQEIFQIKIIEIDYLAIFLNKSAKVNLKNKYLH